MQGVENAGALVDEDSRSTNAQWIEHLDANGLHLSVPFELLCCGVRDVREVVGSVYSPPDGDIRCDDFVVKEHATLFSNSAPAAHAKSHLSFFELSCASKLEQHWPIRTPNMELGSDREMGDPQIKMRVAGRGVPLQRSFTQLGIFS
jgi:hypothetical protein